MTSGIEGTGPYARLKDLRVIAKGYRYELRLIKEGQKRQYAASTYERMLKSVQDDIRKINAEIKADKKK